MKYVPTIVIGAMALLVLGMQACSSEEAAAPSRPPIPQPVGEGGVDGGNDPEGGGGDGGPGTCFDTSKNKPTTPAQFLNQCNSTECFKFDNAARIEGFTPGALPPLN